MRVYYHTFGCKANQYDTERMRQELEARGALTANDFTQADVCVVNTCTVTNHADAQARRFVRRLRRENPGARIVVAGCSAALRTADYHAMDGVEAVVPGHDPVGIAQAVTQVLPSLVQLGIRRSLDRLDMEPVGGEILTHRVGSTRGWVKIQDGCDRKCSFCATRLARGVSRSRKPDQIIAEARALALRHPELVLTGIHIGHYGRDLDAPTTLSGVLARLLDEVPDVRFRLGSIEASEIDDPLLELLATSDGRVAPHLHMPLQSGSDSVLRRMSRWHTREAYRARALEIAARVTPLGLGADIITGFPGETHDDHAQTRALIEELPFTYLHVFPFSPRDGTTAASMPDTVPQRVAAVRSRELRELAERRGRAYRESRVGGRAVVVLEGGSGTALTEDYLRVRVAGSGQPSTTALHSVALEGSGDELHARVTMPAMCR